MTEPTGPRAGGMDEHEREIVRLNRRLRRLETSLDELELLRDGNSRLLDQLMRDLTAERERSEALLLNVLPRRIVDRLHAGETTIADRHDDVAVVFGDFVAFTERASRAAPSEIVADLNGFFSRFDAICEVHGVEKIKTIGDAYLAVAGLADPKGDPVAAAAQVALEMRAAVEANGAGWTIRIGLDVGPVVAGVIGTHKFAYDVWGDTVNTASRLETTAPAGGIQVSAAAAARLAESFELERRGEVDLKGKGPTPAFLLIGPLSPPARLQAD